MFGEENGARSALSFMVYLTML